MAKLDKYRLEHSQDIPYDETHFILDLPADNKTSLRQRQRQRQQNFVTTTTTTTSTN